jgi:phage baseplate assembly protein gpV
MAVQIDVPTLDNALESPVESERDVHAPLTTHTRCLCRFDDGAVFAYVERGHDFVRASDRELWAVERDDVLVSVRSGLALARRRGRVYFADENDEPLYYERAI